MRIRIAGLMFAVALAGACQSSVKSVSDPGRTPEDRAAVDADGVVRRGRLSKGMKTMSVEACVSDAEKMEGKTVRVVSMPCWRFFDAQEAAYKTSVLGGEVGLRVAVEAGVELGWHKYIGCDGLMIGLQSYGASAPASDLKEHFGFTPEKIVARILSALPVEA